MKKQLLTIFLMAAASIALKAQAPDFGFETWSAIAPPTVNAEDPTGWASFNGVSLLGMPLTVVKETTAPAVGSTSVKVITDIIPSLITVANPFVPGQNLDTVGVVGIGKTMLSAPYAKYGYPYTQRSATLSFQCKYNPNPNAIAGVPDTAYVFAYLTKWNSTSKTRDYIAAGMFKTWLSSTTYSSQNVAMVYDPAFNSVFPDSQQVFISSSIYAGPGAKKGSTFYVDGLQWSGYVSTADIDGQNVQVSIYPNPASTSINFKTNVDAEKINVIDIAGRLVGTYNLIDNKVTISTENYASGVYFYNLLNAEKQIISRDKFEVIK